MNTSKKDLKQELLEDIQRIENKYYMYKRQDDSYRVARDKIIYFYSYGNDENYDDCYTECFKAIERLRPVIVDIWSDAITDIDKYENGKPFKLLVTDKKNGKYFNGYYDTSLITDKSIDKVIEKVYLTFGKNEYNDKIYIQFNRRPTIHDLTTPDKLEKINEENPYMEYNTNMHMSSKNSILFVSNGCDFLFEDYMKLIPYLCDNSNLDIKVLNKNLYCKQKGYNAYSERDYKKFKDGLDYFKETFSFRFDQDSNAIINRFLNDIVIPMKYDPEIEQDIIETLKAVNPSKEVEQPKQKSLFKKLFNGKI